MRGNETIIARLNQALHSELTAIHQYMLDAEMCENWGYGRLAPLFKKQAMDEMKHAERLIERILFLDGTPEMGGAFTIQPGASVKAQLELQLKLETEAVREYNESVKIAADLSDQSTKELFDSLLADEEEHADFLETQLSLIEQTGLGNYLAQQIRS